MLRVRRRREQAVDEPLVGVGRRVLQERVDVLDLRRQAGERERHAVDQRFLVRLARGRQAIPLELRKYEAVDIVRDAAQKAVCGTTALRRDERPVRLVLGAVVDPLPQDRDLLRRERLVRRLGRHPLVGIARRNPADELAALRVPRHDRELALRLGQLRRRDLGDVEPQLRLARGRVRAVALEAVLREDRPNVPVVVDLVGAQSRRDPASARAAGEETAAAPASSRTAPRGAAEIDPSLRRARLPSLPSNATTVVELIYDRQFRRRCGNSESFLRGLTRRVRTDTLRGHAVATTEPRIRSQQSRPPFTGGNGSFAELGYEGASLRMIAEDAGVSFQLITYYFGSKEELWVATVDYLFERYLETGKGLGFTPTGNLHEQFHNHLRLLLTDMLQRPQLRKIWVQEYLARSERYTKVIEPKIKHSHESALVPLLRGSRPARDRQAIQRGRDRPAVVVARTEQRRESVLRRVAARRANRISEIRRTASRLAVRDFVDDAEEQDRTVPARIVTTDGDAASPAATSARGGVVYDWGDAKELTPAANRLKQLEHENLQLKQLVGSLSLEKKLLLDRLSAIERA